MFVDTEETNNFTAITIQTEPPEEIYIMSIANDYYVTQNFQGYILYYRDEPVGYFDHLHNLFDHIAEILNQ